MSSNESNNIRKSQPASLPPVVLSDGRIFRYACLAGAVFITINLFWLGAKPVALGLFHPPLDKVAHIATYGLISTLLWLFLHRRYSLLVIVIVSFIGVADEFHQRFLPGRSAGLGDLAADIFAAVVIVSLLALGRRRND